MHKISLFFLSAFTGALFAQTPEALTLREAWRMALEANPSEEAAAARLEQAEARWRQTRAAYQPRLEATASGARVEHSDSARQRNPLLGESDETYDATLRATYLLWDGGQRPNRTRAARAGVEASLASLEDTRQDLLAGVARAFTAAQLARENVRISTTDAEFQARQLEDIRRRVEAGAASRADLLNFDIRRLAAENAAVAAEASYAGAIAALTALLGREQDDPPPPPDAVDMDAPAPEAPNARDAWHEAADSLPSLQQAAQRVEAARAAIRAERATTRPTLAAFGEVGASRLDDPAFSGDDVGNVVGAQLSWDLWDGGLRRQRVAEAEATLREAEAGARAVRLEAQSRLTTTVADYEAAVIREGLARQSLALSLENRDLVETAFRAGQESLLRLNEAQRDYTTAEARAVQARLQREQAWIDLLRAMGRLGLGGD